MAAILFGSISTVADTSELQRESFNEAFAAHGLDWRWERDDYLAMLEQQRRQGPRRGVRRARAARRSTPTPSTRRSRRSSRSASPTAIEPRAGVVETVEAARRTGSSSASSPPRRPRTSRALAEALRGTLDLADFDLVVDAGQVDQAKPRPAAYAFALEQLGVPAAECVAIEDNVGGVQSAAPQAGVTASPSRTRTPPATTSTAPPSQVDRLDAAQLIGLATSA